MNNKWHMNRFGLIDFWYYNYQEFYFKEGHMMLRGGNGSGKSVTMQSFLPLILDGNKSGSRLDPFGSRDRKIEDYLLDESGVRDNRIGYLFLEFKRKDLEIYKTIGIGMQAKRNAKLNTWYFVIDDNRRIGKEIELYQRNLAISKQSLKNMIGDQLIESQGEYCRRVNEVLFGFETEQEYKEVLDLIIQLRSPKLSNSLKPATLNEILNNSLQPLSDEDLRPVTEAITSMDATKDQVLILEENVRATKKIIEVYDQYNYRTLYDKTLSYLALDKKLKNIEKETQEAKQNHIDADNEKQTLEKDNIMLKHEMDKLNDEKSSLLREDLESLVLQANNEKKEIKDTEINLTHKQTQIETKGSLWHITNTNLKSAREKASFEKKHIQNAFTVLEDLQTQLQFEEHLAIKNEMIENLEKLYNPAYTYKRIESEVNDIQLGLEKFRTISKLEDEHNTYLEIVEKERVELELIEKQLDKEKTKMYQLIENTTVAYHQWNNQNIYLKIDTPTLEDIVLEIEKCEETDRSLDIFELVHKVYTRQNTAFIKSEQNLAHSIKLLRQDLTTLKDNLKIWRETLDPKLPLDESTQKNRILLREYGIKPLSLYELLEFDDNISEPLKGQVEEKLRRSNLLGAQLVKQDALNLITSKNNETSDHYLVTTKQVEDLEPFILTQEFIQQEDWSMMFDYLGINDMVFKNKNEHFFYSHLYSVISTTESAKYIGKKARQAYREKEISRLTLEIEIIDGKIEDILHEQDDIENRKHLLHQEYSAMPKLTYIHQCRTDIVLYNEHSLAKIKSIEANNNRLEALFEKAKSDRVYVSNIANKLAISSTERAFSLRKEYLQEYKSELSNMLKHHELYLKDLEMFNKLENDLETLDEDINILRDEVATGKRKMDRLRTSVIKIETQLEQKGYADIKKRLEAIEESLQDKQATEKLNIGRIGSLSAKISELTQSINQLLMNYDDQKLIRNDAQSIYEQELQLGYVYNDDRPKEILKHISDIYPNLKNITELSFELQDAIHNNRASLQEYNLTRHTIFSDLEAASRLDIKARYAGENINIKTLHDYLDAAIQEQKLLLEEKDRKLIQDILINTISKKIRNRIQNSKAWVNRINRYMDDMNTSSGLKLSLNWQSKSGETEDELNSEKLVSLMERDVRLLRDEDKKALSKHFESKINLARKKAELEETHESFHQIMSKIMDFRTWFDFKIMVQKHGERKRELTNTIFNTYSGGEKAMSMYIPLFSALAAKYEGGREDAPNIIALDEAFAGVDENNIGNMFELIRNYKFDYIMNSQVLWGDYPSVKSLAIYELFRPENVPYVTVVRYEWNGVTKRMVT